MIYVYSPAAKSFETLVLFAIMDSMTALLCMRCCVCLAVGATIATMSVPTAMTIRVELACLVAQPNAQSAPVSQQKQIGDDEDSTRCDCVVYLLLICSLVWLNSTGKADHHSDTCDHLRDRAFAGAAMSSSAPQAKPADSDSKYPQSAKPPPIEVRRSRRNLFESKYSSARFEVAHDDQESVSLKGCNCTVCCKSGSTLRNPLLRCEGASCGVQIHFKCVTPPLSAVPGGDWFCADCAPVEHAAPATPCCNCEELTASCGRPDLLAQQKPVVEVCDR